MNVLSSHSQMLTLMRRPVEAGASVLALDPSSTFSDRSDSDSKSQAVPHLRFNIPIVQETAQFQPRKDINLSPLASFTIPTTRTHPPPPPVIYHRTLTHYSLIQHHPINPPIRHMDLPRLTNAKHTSIYTKRQPTPSTCNSGDARKYPLYIKLVVKNNVQSSDQPPSQLTSTGDILMKASC